MEHDDQFDTFTNVDDLKSDSYGDTITISSLDLNSSISSLELGSSSNTINYYGPGATVGGFTTTPNWNGSAYSYTTNNTGNYTIAGAGTAISNNTVNISGEGLTLDKGADIKIGGQSLKEFMKKMEQRLAILVPDPAKLEKFEALKKAYEHYKTMESLCFDESKENE